MKLSEMLEGESKYLRAVDFAKGFEAQLTIAGVRIEDIGQENTEKKAVLYFKGKDKGLVLNKTNGGKLVDAFGDETDTYAGKEVLLYRDITDFKGTPTPCLRIRPVAVAAEGGGDIPF